MLFDELHTENKDLTKRCKAYEARIKFLEEAYDALVEELLKERESAPAEEREAND